MLYITMIYEFFKIGLFSVGGGLATLPFLFDLSGKYNWFTAEELTNMIAVSESTPGPIGVNMATYVGNTVGGVLGGIVTTLSLVTPSLIVIFIIAGFLNKFKDNMYVKDLFYGLRAAVAGLISAAVVLVLLQTFINARTLDTTKLTLFAILTFCVLKFKKHPIVYIAAGAVVGVLLKL